MTSLVEAHLINDPFGDPGLHLDFRFGRRALLFDLGDLTALPARKLLRVSHVFVSHAHVDHFCGFERLLRVCLRRPARLDLFGPPGFTERVAHKLAAYSWNLVTENEIDFVVGAAEFNGDELTVAEFHSREAFARRDVTGRRTEGVLLDENTFRVRATILDHGIPSLAFAFEEKDRINIWKSGLDRMGLPVGPWLNELKEAIRRGDPDSTLMAVPRSAAVREDESRVSLGELKIHAVRVVPGRKIAYVVDAAFHEANATRIIDLAWGAERIFIEAVFLSADTEIAARYRHLTAAQAGSLARRAGASRIVPFHFSSRYLGRADELKREAEAAFRSGGERRFAAGAQEHP